MNPITKYYGNIFIILFIVFIIVGIVFLKADNTYYWIILLGIFIMIGVIFQFRRFVKKRKDNE
jgi:L-asparagine transporter-like permease